MWPATANESRDFAAWSGRESFQEWVGHEPAQELKRVLERADTKWQHVHELLARFSLEYRTKGSGAVVVDRDDPNKLHAKASHIGRFASLGKVEERLGSFEPVGQQPKRERTGEHTVISEHKAKSYARYLKAGATRADERQPERASLYGRYTAAKQEWERAEGRKGESAFQQQRASEKARFESLRQENRAARERIKSSQAKTSKKLLYSVQAFIAASEREQLRLDTQRERKELKARYDHSRPGRWPEWLAQRAMEGEKAAVAALRRRRNREQNRSLDAPPLQIGTVVGVGDSRTAMLASIRWTIDKRGVNYALNHTTVFRDEGCRVVFNDINDDAIRTGLMLCREKWIGGLSISGTDEFKAKAHKLAAEMGIRTASQERGGPPDTKQIRPASAHSAELEQSQIDALDFEQLSAAHDKPLTESNAGVGRRHEGRVVAAGQTQIETGWWCLISAGSLQSYTLTEASRPKCSLK